MKRFIKNIPGQIAGTFTIMMVCFTVKLMLSGIDEIPVARLPEMFLLSVIGGIWMEFTFGTCVIRRMTDVKRVCVFVVPFAAVTFICAVMFRWITELKAISTYVKFFGIFAGCGAVSAVLFETEHRIRGRKYTEKLREYQKGENFDESKS